MTEESLSQNQIRLLGFIEIVPDITVLRELPTYGSLEQVWIEDIEFYVSPTTDEVFRQSADQADYEMGVERIVGSGREEILKEFSIIRERMKIKNKKDLGTRLKSSLTELKREGVLVLPDQRHPQYPNDDETGIIKRVEEEGLRGYMYLSKQAGQENLLVCYGSTEEKKQFWPWPNFTLKDIANDITFSFQENRVPYIFRRDIYSPILIHLNEECTSQNGN